MLANKMCSSPSNIFYFQHQCRRLWRQSCEAQYRLECTREIKCSFRESSLGAPEQFLFRNPSILLDFAAIRAMCTVHFQVLRDSDTNVFHERNKFKFLIQQPIKPFGALSFSCYSGVDTFRYLEKILIISGPILQAIQVMLDVKKVIVTLDDFKAF